MFFSLFLLIILKNIVFHVKILICGNYYFLIIIKGFFMGSSVNLPAYEPPQIPSSQIQGKPATAAKTEKAIKAKNSEEMVDQMIDQFMKTIGREHFSISWKKKSANLKDVELPENFVQESLEGIKSPQEKNYHQVLLRRTAEEVDLEHISPTESEEVCEACEEIISQFEKLQAGVLKKFGISHTQIATEIRNRLELVKQSYEAYLKVEKEGPEKARQKELSKLLRTISKSEKGIVQLMESIKTAKIGLKNIAQGKAKKVWKDLHYVYYTPMKGLFGLITFLKKLEMKAEVLIANRIKQNLARNGVEGKNLHLDLEVMPEEERIDGEFTIRTGKGLGSLDNFFERLHPLKHNKDSGFDLEDLNPEENIDSSLVISHEELERNARFGQEFLNGMSDLHGAGFVHGDIKLDNILVFLDPNEDEHENLIFHIKISDLGKTRPIKEDQELLYSGNMRCVSPEGKLSKKGEVYSAAIVLINMLEEGLPKNKNGMLINPSVEKGIEIKQNRTGIVKFLLSNAKCSQTDTFFGRIKAFGSSLTKKTYPEEQIEVRKYIDALINKMNGNSKYDPAKMEKLRTLLYDMTSLDKDMRPTMAEAAERYGEIFSA